MNNSVVILGRGRCGSSAVAGAIERMGIPFAGIKKKIFDKGVLRGYYEKGEVSDFVNSNIGQDKVVKGEPTKHFKNTFRLFKGMGIKNHKLIYLMPWIMKEDPQTKVIYCSRNKRKQAKSINKACWNNKKDYGEILRSIDNYEKILKSLNLNYLEVKFDRLIKNPGREVKRIAKYLNLKPNQEAIKFINPKYSLFK